MQRFRNRCLGLLVAVAAMVGCQDRKVVTTDEEVNDTITVAEVRRELDEAAEATKQLANQTQDEYIEALDAQLEQLDESIEEMEEAGARMVEDAKADWHSVTLLSRSVTNWPMPVAKLGRK